MMLMTNKSYMTNKEQIFNKFMPSISLSLKKITEKKLFWKWNDKWTT